MDSTPPSSAKAAIRQRRGGWLMDEGRTWRVAIAALLGLLIRATFLAINPDALAADPDAYRAIAQTLSESGVYGLTDAMGQTQPTAFRPPLYPAMLSLLIREGQLPLASVAILHVSLGIVAVVCTSLASEMLLASWQLPHRRRRVISLLAGVFVAVDPILLRASTQVMTETLAVALTAAAMLVWIKLWTPGSTGRHSGAGQGFACALALASLLAAAVLCRPTFLVWAAAVVLVMLVIAGRFLVHRQRATWVALLIVLVVGGAIGGWTIRNWRVMGHPVWATSHGGYTMLLANNPSMYDYLAGGPPQNAGWLEAWDATAFLSAHAHRAELQDPTDETFWRKEWKSVEPKPIPYDELEDDRRMSLAAKSFMRRHPIQFAWSALARVDRLWSPLPQKTPNRSWALIAGVGVYYFFIYGCLLIALMRWRGRLLQMPWLSGWALWFALTAVHSVYFTNIRMRA
ncbi:MAG: hypothetical protein AAGA03_15735, partial [Planctomycetota bacterium]